MIHVSQARGLTEESGNGTGDSVEALGALLMENAPKFGIKEEEISETWAEGLAKGLRWPAARGGMRHKAKPKEESGHE